MEVEGLFQYLEEFGKGNNKKFILVMFIDDLDRCLGSGRIVKVLEAVQLVLAIPSAPVIVFLAIDTRVVVSSIEHNFNESILNASDTMITGE
jgi:predicted KAP-like P-loop ATPase